MSKRTTFYKFLSVHLRIGMLPKIEFYKPFDFQYFSWQNRSFSEISGEWPMANENSVHFQVVPVQDINNSNNVFRCSIKFFSQWRDCANVCPKAMVVRFSKIKSTWTFLLVKSANPFLNWMRKFISNILCRQSFAVILKWTAIKKIVNIMGTRFGRWNFKVTIISNGEYILYENCNKREP